MQISLWVACCWFVASKAYCKCYKSQKWKASAVKKLLFAGLLHVFLNQFITYFLTGINIHCLFFTCVKYFSHHTQISYWHRFVCCSHVANLSKVVVLLSSLCTSSSFSWQPRHSSQLFQQVVRLTLSFALFQALPGVCDTSCTCPDWRQWWTGRPSG